MSAVRSILVVVAVVLAIPLLALLVLWLRAGKVVVVQNVGSTGIEVTETISDGNYVEHTDATVLGPGKTTWLYFFPKIKGPLLLRCVGAGSSARVSLGIDPGRFLYSNVTLDGCDRVVRRSGFTL
ncbi:MAG: hypothetical protein JOZ72_07830 [Alphaproteobacteria bacterium]|nr:hypothetical protein [Alphaproteobacteria bacterium]